MFQSESYLQNARTTERHVTEQAAPKMQDSAPWGRLVLFALSGLVLFSFLGCEKKYITIVQAPGYHEPRVIWVPDEYEKIQDAILASEDGDTIRVKPGIYYEGIRFWGKSIWLESFLGPETTRIDGRGWNDGIAIMDGEKSAAIRGFTISGEENGVRVLGDCNAQVQNSIFKGRANEHGGLMSGIWVTGEAHIYNCVFDSCDIGVGVGYSAGVTENSIFIKCLTGYYQGAYWNNWHRHNWNLFWNNIDDFSDRATAGDNDVFDDPQFLQGSYRLSLDSPAINQGNPDIFDRDRTRSDIGLYGGPFSYIP